MNELEFLKEIVEYKYLQDQNIVRNAKIMAGITKEKNGQIIVNICFSKERAIMYAKKFIKKHKRECYIYDFTDYPDVIMWTKFETGIVNCSELFKSKNNLPTQNFN